MSLLNRNCQKIFQPQLLIPEDALLCGEVDLDGGVSPGVIDLAGVDLLDGHLAGKPADLKDGVFSTILFFPQANL